MTTCLTFLSATAEETTGIFGDPFSLASGPLRTADSPHPGFPPYSLAVRGPSARCARTADALGLETVPEPALRNFDYGRWYGRTVADVVAEDPYGYSAWLTDPDAAPHGGESVRDLCERTARWLDALPSDTDRALAVVEPSVIRGALVHAFSVPARAFRHLDLPCPPAVVSLILRGDGWHVRYGHGSASEVHRTAPDEPVSSARARPADRRTAGREYTGGTYGPVA
ncbi:histidine phosphatase family protein [Streptomyces sp. NPDC002265]|uniref:histidine phosphatase family protein n=1 Tax=Streptomyces sp. NPDC002265 TaxID=3154415 RepID=UPI00332AEDE2